MLCPDVWNYRVPKNIITYKNGSLDNKSTNYITKLITAHPFNEIISIVLPGEYKTPQSIFDLIKDSDHYKVKNFRLPDILQKPFLEGFIKRGKFIAISENVTCAENDDRCAISPDGFLTLAVSKDIYQCLGVEGHPILNSRTQKDKFIISIDLKNSNMHNGTNYFDRIKRALSHELLPKISLRFTWDPPESSDICPSSVAKYLNDNGYKVELCQTKVKAHQEYSLKFPKMNPVRIKDEDLPHEFVEYLAMCMLGCEGESDFSSYKFKSNTEDIGTVRIVHCKGLFSSSFIMNLVEELRNYQASVKKFSWVAVYINGFPNIPVDFFNQDHIFSCNGDNGFVLCLYENNNYFLYKNVSSNKSSKR